MACTVCAKCKREISAFTSYCPHCGCFIDTREGSRTHGHNDTPDTSTIALQCSNGITLHIKGATLIVAKKSSEESFPISKIQSFSLTEPKALSQGRIIFRTAQAATMGIRLGFGFSAAIGAEQTFFFKSSEIGNALLIKDYIARYDERIGSPPVSDASEAKTSVADEIRELKSLLDEGILSQDEFNAKKNQLLNL